MWISYFSRISSSTWILESSFWETWDWFAARWRVTLVVAVRPGALTLNAMVSGGDVGESLLSFSLSPNLLSTVHGFSILISLSRRSCFSHMTSCADVWRKTHLAARLAVSFNQQSANWHLRSARVSEFWLFSLHRCHVCLRISKWWMSRSKEFALNFASSSTKLRLKPTEC